MIPSLDKRKTTQGAMTKRSYEPSTIEEEGSIYYVYDGTMTKKTLATKAKAILGLAQDRKGI